MKPLSEEILRDKIKGCFLGKNVGGTLGAPFEVDTNLQNVSFYTQELNGNPLPNDDLDLQLPWLILAEYYGLDHLTSRHFGEYWINAIIGPWGEYSNCRWNCLEGFFPPLSGACENDGLCVSNGAWIRSEIWACLCAGHPENAIRYAWMDASCDHKGDGIYAEMFIAAMEAAAFCCSDIRELLKIGLANIPPAGRLRECIELVIAGFDAGKDWQTVRNEVVEKNQDIGWFQAAINVPFVVIALLYGGGDFGKTVCLAVNCGDDTDCTGATAGAIIGIIQGASALPEKWLTPIGEGIVTWSLNNFALPLPAPANITELTQRIINVRKIAEIRDPQWGMPADDLYSSEMARSIWERPEYELRFDLLFARLDVEFPDGPYVKPGQPCRIKIKVRDSITPTGVIRLHWLLPENWVADPAELRLGVRNFCQSVIECSVTPPEGVLDAMNYLYLEVRADDRNAPVAVTIPLRNKAAYSFPRLYLDSKSDCWLRRCGAMRRIKGMAEKGRL